MSVVFRAVLDVGTAALLLAACAEAPPPGAPVVVPQAPVASVEPAPASPAAPWKVGAMFGVDAREGIDVAVAEADGRRVSVDEGELTDEAAAERVGALLFGDV